MTTPTGSSLSPRFTLLGHDETRWLGGCPALLAALLACLGCGHDWSGPSGSDAETTGPGDASDADAVEGDGADVVEVPGYCGNGIVDPWEECDDGNDVPGDGCETNCAWTCVAGDDCGDGQVCNGSEVCRDHVCATDPETMPPDGTPCATPGGGDGSCRGGLCAGVACGNGVVDPGEECDDGDGDNTDECLTDCRGASCGDGFVRVGFEECEEGSVRSCTTTCETSGTQGCVRCRWSRNCLPPVETCCNLLDDDCDGSTDGMEEGCCPRNQTVTYNIPAGTEGGPQCITLSGGTCTAVASCVAPGRSVEADQPPAGVVCPTGVANAGTLTCRLPEGSSWTCMCTPLVECIGGRAVATGFTW